MTPKARPFDAIDPRNVVVVLDPDDDTPVRPTLLALNGQSPYGDLPEPWDCRCGTGCWTARWMDAPMSVLERDPDGSGTRGVWRLRRHNCAGPTQPQKRAPTRASASGTSWSEALYDRGG